MPTPYLGSTFGVCSTPQVGAKTQSELAALTYNDACCAENLPGFIKEANTLTANCIDGTRLTAVGFDAESTVDLAVYYTPTCTGQDTLRAAVATQTRLAVKLTLPDGTPTSTPTIIYAIVKVASGTYGGQGGGGEDWVIDNYSLIIDQDPILVKPTAIP